MIRPATLSDAKNLAVLAPYVWLHTYATDGVRDAISDYLLQEFTPDRFATMISDKAHQLFVAEQNSHLVGYLSLALDAPCSLQPDIQIELATLYVQERFCGKGIGTHLLEAAEGYIHTLGQPTLWLSVASTNPRALAFYKKHHFQTLGTTFFQLEAERYENDVLAKTLRIFARSNYGKNESREE